MAIIASDLAGADIYTDSLVSLHVCANNIGYIDQVCLYTLTATW